MPPSNLAEVLGAVLDLLADVSFGFTIEVPTEEGGDTGLAVVVFGCASSSEESPPARASSSASRSAILR